MAKLIYKDNIKYNIFDKNYLEKNNYKKSSIYSITINKCNNNFFISLNDLKGKLLYRTCSGEYGFKNTQKVSIIAITQVIQSFFKKIFENGIRNIGIIYKGYQRQWNKIYKIFNDLNKDNFNRQMLINWLILKNNIPHNGGRKKKQRRL